MSQTVTEWEICSAMNYNNWNCNSIKVRQNRQRSECHRPGFYKTVSLCLVLSSGTWQLRWFHWTCGRPWWTARVCLPKRVSRGRGSRARRRRSTTVQFSTGQTEKYEPFKNSSIFMMKIYLYIRNLPAEIRVTGWAPAPRLDYSARFLKKIWTNSINLLSQVWLQQSHLPLLLPKGVSLRSLHAVSWSENDWGTRFQVGFALVKYDYNNAAT